MTLHEFLNIFVAISFVLAISRWYARLGLLLITLGFLAEALYTLLNHDLILSLAEVIASFYALLEFTKISRYHHYPHWTTRVIAGIVLVILGIWTAVSATGATSPFLAAGIISLILIILEHTNKLGLKNNDHYTR